MYTFKHQTGEGEGRCDCSLLSSYPPYCTWTYIYSYIKKSIIILYVRESAERELNTPSRRVNSVTRLPHFDRSLLFTAKRGGCVAGDEKNIMCMYSRRCVSVGVFKLKRVSCLPVCLSACQQTSPRLCANSWSVGWERRNSWRCTCAREWPATS